MRILLLEDDERLRILMTRVLDEAGHQVHAMANGQDLLAFLQRQDVDAVLTDVFMPGVDGLEALRLVRETRPHVPVVVFSGGAATMGNFLTLAAKLGAAAVLEKPMTPEVLLRTVASLAVPATPRAGEGPVVAKPPQGGLATQ